MDMEPFRKMTQPEIDAFIAKMEADAAKSKAEAWQAQVGAELLENDMLLAKLAMAEVQENEEKRLASDHHHRTYRFTSTVGDGSVKTAIEKLTTWHRIDPECEITFVINSAGGDIIAGFHLFDTLKWLGDEGHDITTVGLGMAASMGGVILQAGKTRVMGPRASLLIHEASFVAGGSMGDIEDTVEFVKSLQNRILQIFADRSTLSKAQIKNRWKRKNWWLTAQQALEFGLVDEVR